MINPEKSTQPIDYSSGEWMDKLTIYQVGDLVTYPDKFGQQVLTVTKIREVRPGDYKFAQHIQYVELSDQFGIIEINISAALIEPFTPIEEVKEKDTNLDINVEKTQK